MRQRQTCFKFRFIRWASFALFIAPSTIAAESFDIIKVAPGVYAAIGKPEVLSNGAFVVNGEDVLVVDTHYRPSWARDLVAEIKKVTGLPVRYVVNTHWHNDHVQGNQSYVNVFGRNVEYLAQHTAREDIISKAIPSVQQSLERLPGQIANWERMLAEGRDQQGRELTAERRTQLQNTITSQKAYLEELKTIQITLPTITFERSLVLHKGERSIHVYHFGRGHTRGDVVVFLPKERVVITGDLLTNGIPFMRDAYPSQWIATLESVEKLEWDQAITGHGGVQQGKEQIGKLIAYMKDMVAAVRGSIGKMTLEEALKTIDMSKHAANFPSFEGGNRSAIQRTWAELSGQIRD